MIEWINDWMNEWLNEEMNKGQGVNTQPVTNQQTNKW